MSYDVVQQAEGSWTMDKFLTAVQAPQDVTCDGFTPSLQELEAMSRRLRMLAKRFLLDTSSVLLFADLM